MARGELFSAVCNGNTNVVLACHRTMDLFETWKWYLSAGDTHGVLLFPFLFSRIFVSIGNISNTHISRSCGWIRPDLFVVMVGWLKNLEVETPKEIT
jgi:hypothetical protein